MADQKKDEAKTIPLTETAAPSMDAKQQAWVVELVKGIMSEMVPQMMAMQLASVQASRAAPSARDAQLAVLSGEQCKTCRQLLSACKDKHVTMVVYPEKYPEYGEHFRGVGVNTVWYRSNGPGHAIPVPAQAAAEIARIVIEYEENERATRNGGRASSHDSGSVTNGNVVTRPIMPGVSTWR